MAAKRQKSKPSKKATKKPPEKTTKRISLIQRLINSLKRIIGHKKGERNEFRYNYEEGHPEYVFQAKNGKYKAMGVTHRNETFGRKNMPLSQNPEKGKKEDSYIRNGIISSKKKNFGAVMKNYRFADRDKANVKSKKRNYKKVVKRQRAKRRKKKSK